MLYVLLILIGHPLLIPVIILVCGDPSDITENGGSLDPDEADCSFPCSGDPIHLCGGGGVLSYYEWQGNLSTWHTPENIGRYEVGTLSLRPALYSDGLVNYSSSLVDLSFRSLPTLVSTTKFSSSRNLGRVHRTLLVTSLIIDLLSSNSHFSGAYELDLTLVDDFEKTWREMHVKTDVFCSGSVTLPDKAGRLINVGGWSLISTFGIRLYAPSGSAGVNGTTDWEENAEELALQVS